MLQNTIKSEFSKLKHDMLKEETNDECGVVNNWARPCDTCQSAACTVYCRADSAYLCSGCDARVHAANRVASRHERVWVCEACERAPAAFLCKADAASICIACDADIHSANPLARRHQRVPIPPISGLEQRRRGVASAAETEDDFIAPEADEDEAASWLLLNPGKDGTYQNNGLLFDEEEDEYLDLEEYTSSAETQFADQYNQSHQSYSTQQKNNGIDRVVPIQNGSTKYQQQQDLQFSTEYESSKTAYSYNGSISNSVSISSLDIGVVPESTVSEISIIHARPPKGTIDLFSGSSAQVPPQLTPLDREARVLRYREKKKNRKFEKTIRYASRKAYAETRPRIKGRFAKRTDVEVEVDQMFSTAMITENGYSIVPSF